MGLRSLSSLEKWGYYDITELVIISDQKLFVVSYYKTENYVTNIGKITARRVLNCKIRFPSTGLHKYWWYDPSKDAIYLPKQLAISPNYTYIFKYVSDKPELENHLFTYVYFFLNLIFDKQAEKQSIDYIREVLKSLFSYQYHENTVGKYYQIILKEYMTGYIMKISSVNFVDKRFSTYHIDCTSTFKTQVKITDEKYKESFMEKVSNMNLYIYSDHLGIVSHLNSHNFYTRAEAELQFIVKRKWLDSAVYVLLNPDVRALSNLVYLEVIKTIRNFEEVKMMVERRDRTSLIKELKFSVYEHETNSENTPVLYEKISPVFILYNHYKKEIKKCFSINVGINYDNFIIHEKEFYPYEIKRIHIYFMGKVEKIYKHFDKARKEDIWPMMKEFIDNLKPKVIYKVYLPDTGAKHFYIIINV